MGQCTHGLALDIFKNPCFSSCRQLEWVLQEQDVVFFRRIHHLDAVEALDILFDVDLLRMPDIVFNPLNYYRQNVSPGIVAQSNQGQPVHFNLVAESKPCDLYFHQLRTQNLGNAVEVVLPLCFASRVNAMS